MIFFSKTISFIFIFFLISGCSGVPDKDNNLFNKNSTKSNSNNKEKLEIKISCNEGKIEDFLEKGWKISEEYSDEKVCSWKSVPANKNCNVEKDKGCKIITPDKIGREIIYILERDIK